MQNIVVVYDNILRPNKKIQTIIGNKSYADIILKRRKIYDKYTSIFEQKKYIKEVIRVDTKDELKTLKWKIRNMEDTNIVHIFSNYLFTNGENFSIILDKASYINEDILVNWNDKPVMVMWYELDKYLQFLDNYEFQRPKIDEKQSKIMEVQDFIDLEDYGDFLYYISGGFDARFFNKMYSDENIVIKKSTDKQKIKKEYEYYHLLPDEAKKWMVLPYDYKETEEYASYTMERVFMPDIAIRWIHRAIDQKEFVMILNKLFYYIKTRKKKPVSKEEYEKVAQDLYVVKLKKRIEELKKHPKYSIFAEYIRQGTNYDNIDEIIEKYTFLYERIGKESKNYELVIGHGDLCFSNILYNEETNMVRLIDPKGALKEEDLWTNPYYDIAKLSHSICGLYDFFNCGLYRIELNEDLKFKIHIDYDNQEYKEIFKQKLEENNYDYIKIRIYEASLFLSMLPLHMDYPKKVFGFLLNGIKIVEEVEKMLKEKR